MGGQFFGGGSGGGGTPGDAPGGAAGGDLSGTYPNPGVANLNGVAAASYALLAGPTFTGTVTLPASTVTSGMILDGTIVTGDLNAAAGITSGQLAGSIAPSKITGTAITAGDSGTVTSAMIADATIVNADVSASAAITSGKIVQVVPAGPIAANPDLIGFSSGSGNAVTTALKPTFMPVKAPASTMVLAGLGTRVSTAVAASTMGVAIYSILYSGAGTYSATLVAQLNASISTASATGIVSGLITTGAVGSGTGTVTLDFTANQYVIGTMASTATTLAPTNVGALAGFGCLSWTATARSSVTDWPASFTQASGVAAAAAKINHSFLFTADAVNWL